MEFIGRNGKKSYYVPGVRDPHGPVHANVMNTNFCTYPHRTSIYIFYENQHIKDFGIL